MAKDKNWGRPYIEIAQIYEAAVAKCVKTTKGGDWTKIEFVDKLVYQLAVEYYELAKRIDPSVANEANQRIKNLETLVRDRILRISIGVNTGEIWFVKQKLED